MTRYMTKLLSLVTLSLVSLNVFAQGRILTTLETNPDARTAAMGNVLLGNTDKMHIYNNPSALLFSTQKFGVDLSTEVYPQGGQGRLMQYTLGTAYKFHPDHAVFFGMRYLGGLTIDVSTLPQSGKTHRPYDLTVDFGYGFSVTPEFSVYGSGTYVRSDIGAKTDALTFSFGLGYQRAIELNGHSSLLTVGARLLDAGTPVQYNKTGIFQSLPTSVVVGGDWGINLADDHDLTYALGVRYFTPKEAKEVIAGTGLEYTFAKMISVRGGYEYAQLAGSKLTGGLGIRCKGFTLDLAYRHSLKAVTGVNTFMVGLGFGI